MRVFAGFLAVMIGVLLFDAFVRGRKKLSVDDLRRLWGRSPDRERDMRVIASYHKELERADGESLDDRTWTDLNMDDVYARIDRTLSPVGQQVLYDLLRTPSGSADELADRERWISWLGSDSAARESIQQILARLRSPDLQDVHYLFTGPIPDQSPIARLFPALSVLAAASIVGCFIYPPILFLIPVVGIANFTIQGSYRRKIDIHIHALRQLSALLEAAHALGQRRDEPLAGPLEKLARHAKTLATLRRASLWLIFEQGGTNELSNIIYMYLNYFFLLDLNAFRSAFGSIRAHTTELRETFEAVGTIDAMIAAASYRKGEETVVPTLLPSSRRIECVAIRHPLLDEPVTNDFALENHNILVTGSNMSGKTTFIRAIAVGAIMAQTIHTVTASRWAAPLLHVRTSIGGGDDLVHGKSYYLAEVERIRLLMDDSRDGRQCLFVIDELLRGTNTVERIGAGKAILDHLGRPPHIVLASTHDLELADLLEGYEFHHFAERIVDGELTFDYKLHEGRSSTRNAIAILDLWGFPHSVVTDAEAVVAALLREKRGTKNASETSGREA